MSNVYSFSGFAKVLIENGILFSIRDFLDDKKVDELIQLVIDKQCNEDTYIGAGVERSCFIPREGSYAIKVDKSYYTNYYDEGARYEYEAYTYDNHLICYDGGWVIDSLENITKFDICCEQNVNEIHNYNAIIQNHKHLREFIPQMIAVSSNYCVEIMERCSYCHSSPYYSHYARFNFIDDNFSDAHEDNLGLNRFGKLVILDLGLGGIY